MTDYQAFMRCPFPQNGEGTSRKWLILKGGGVPNSKAGVPNSKADVPNSKTGQPYFLPSSRSQRRYIRKPQPRKRTIWTQRGTSV